MSLSKCLIMGSENAGKKITTMFLTNASDPRFNTRNDIITLDNGLYVTPAINENSKRNFFRKFYNHKETILRAPFHAFLFIVKFENGIFVDLRKNMDLFYNGFGRGAMKNIIFLCIQVDTIIILDENQLIDEFQRSEGYTYIYEKSKPSKINFIAWDNFCPHPNQCNKLIQALNTVEKLDDLALIQFFESIEKCNSILDLQAQRNAESEYLSTLHGYSFYVPDPDFL